MATTAKNIYDYSMTLIDQRLDTGLVDATTTAVYEKNAPYILTMLQDELIRSSDYYKTYTITKSAETDNDGNYEFSNCRFIEHSENSIRNRIKKVLQYDLQGNFIREWKSLSDINSKLNFPIGNISQVCNGKRNKAHNFIWRYTNV